MIVCFGSINADLVFQVDRIPNPGETVSSHGLELFMGGKGANQAVAAARAGVRTAMVGAVGADGWGGVAKQTLADEGIDIRSVLEVNGPTGCAAITVARDGENQIVIAAGANSYVSSDALDRLDCGAGDILMLQMEVPANQNWDALRRFRAKGGRVILNCAPAQAFPAHVLDEIDFLVANEYEIGIVAAERGVLGPDIHTLMVQLAERHEAGFLVTLGPEGAVLQSGSKSLAVPAPQITPVDTTGAGDTFCGVFAASLETGLDVEQAMTRACFAGSLACLKPGARDGMPTKAELDAFIAGAGN